jgi:ParB family chromosome partitioning protein
MSTTRHANPVVMRSRRPEGGGERRLISALRCRVWTQHSRPDEQLTEFACKELRESIAKHGQHQPALGRLVTDDPSYDVEIICGARRHAAALTLNRELLVELRVISDADAYVAMYEENAQRKDDCPYVQGQILRRALLSGAYSCQDDLTGVFGLSRSKISRLLMIAQLPSVIVAAFQAPTDIRERWGVALYQLWKNGDPDHAITGRARALAQMEPRPAARDVYATLITTRGLTSARKRQPPGNVDFRGTNGVILFHERVHLGELIFTIPKATLGATRRHALERALLLVLDATSQEAAPTHEKSPIQKQSPRDSSPLN